jgi:hypothetical protein
VRIVLVNGSPKPVRSVSGRLLDYLAAQLAGGVTGAGRTGSGTGADAGAYAPSPDIIRVSVIADGAALPADADAVVLAFPLYVDSLPSHMIRFLEDVEAARVDSSPAAARPAYFYFIVNNGFFEPRQCRLAVAMAREFCAGAGFSWGGSLSVGGGPMLNFAPVGEGAMSSAGDALRELAGAIRRGDGCGDILTMPDCPVEVYIESAHKGWEKAIIRRGGAVEDLYRFT